MSAMNVQEMKRVISGITSSRARADPFACIGDLNPLLSTVEGRQLLSKQEGEKALVLIDLFDRVLKSHGTPLNKGCILWTLRQLCAYVETLPKSCVLPIDFKSSDPHHAAGGFADVWKGTYDGKEVAFKSIRGSTLTDDAARLKRKRRFCKEVVLWKSLSHPNILGLIGVCRWDNTPDARLTMVSEWMANGNIIEYIKHNDSQRMRLLVDCAKGVQYLHGVNLVHGDLKGANILITSDNPVRACLADFGFMTIVYDDAGGPESTSALGGGTTPFMAPELLSPSMFGKNRCRVSKEADIYAFGMVILQVLTGLIPFYTLRDTEISYKVIQGERPLLPTNASDIGISDELWQLLARCWNDNCIKRPQIDEILQHLCKESARGLIFPPSRLPQAPSYESILESGTNKYADIFVTATANVPTPAEECPPFPMPTSPTESTGNPSYETQDPATSMFSAVTQDTTPATTPGHSQIRVAESKPSASESSPRTISNRSDSTTIGADPADELVAPGQALSVDAPPLWGSGLSQHAYGQDQHDPTIHDTQSPYVDLAETPVPVQGTTFPLSPQPELPGGRPQLPRIKTNPLLESKNSDSPATAFFTPGASGEARYSRPFDSAVNIRVQYSGTGSGSRDVAGPIRRVVDVHQLACDRVKPKHSFPIKPLESPQRKEPSPMSEVVPQDHRDPKAVEVEPRHGLRMSLARPSQIARGGSASSFLSSPFDAFQTEVGSSKPIPEAGTSTILRRGFGSQRKSKLPGRGKGSGIGSDKETMFPRQKGKRMVPRWDDGEVRSEEKCEEKGQEKVDHSRPSSYVSIPNEVVDKSQDQSLAPRSSHNPSFIGQLLTKLGVHKSPKHLRPLMPSNRALTQAQKDGSTPPIPTTSAGPTHTPAVDSDQDRERTLSGFSFVNLRPGSVRMKKGGKAKREATASGDHSGWFY